MMNELSDTMIGKTNIESECGNGAGFSLASSFSGRNVPHFGMQLDRTSFDEADGFGVAPDEVKTKLATYQAPPPTLMKNGKVRRRLRWRPRSPRKMTQAKQQHSQMIEMQRKYQQDQHQQRQIEQNDGIRQPQQTSTEQVQQQSQQQQPQQLPESLPQNTDAELQEQSKSISEVTTSPLENESSGPDVQQQNIQLQSEQSQLNLAPIVPPPPPHPMRGRTLHQQRGRENVKLSNRIPLNLSHYGRGRPAGSNASVVSHLSRQSRVSVHSFASTETAAMSNKKKDQVKKFVIRRPNYYPSELSASSDNGQLDGSDSILDASSHSETIQTDTSQHSRFSPATVGCNPIFAAQLVDVVGAATRSELATTSYVNGGASTFLNEKFEGSNLVALAGRSLPPVLPMPKAKASKSKISPIQRDARSLPPVLKRPDVHSNNRKDAGSHGPLLGPSLGPSAEESDSHAFISSSMSTTSINKQRVSPDPILIGHDEIEEDRLVDLRIVPSHLSEQSRCCNSNISGISSTVAKDAEVGTEPCSMISPSDAQLIDELRSQSFASVSSNNIIVRDADNKDRDYLYNDSDNEDDGHESLDTEADAESEVRDDVPPTEKDTRETSGQQPMVQLKTSSSTLSSQLLSLPAAIKSAVQESFVALRTTKSTISTNSTIGSPSNLNNELEKGAKRSMLFYDDQSSMAVEVVKLNASAHTGRSSKLRLNRKSSDEIRFSMSTSRHSAPPVARAFQEADENNSISSTRSAPPQSVSSSSVGATTVSSTVSVSKSIDNQEAAIAAFDADALGNHVPKESAEYLAFIEAEKNLQAIQEVATEHLQQGEYSEALEVFQEILRGLLTRYGEEHSRVGTAVHNIGVVHMRRGDYNKALVAYKEAVRVRKLVLDEDHPDIAASLAQLGMAYLEVDKHQRAIGAFRESLKIRRKCFGNYHPKVAKVLNNIGCALYELDELEVARVAFEEALDIQRQILSKNTAQGEKNSTNTTLLSIASTQSNIASIKLYFGAFDAAVVDLEEALLMQQSVLGDDHIVVRRTKESLIWLENQRLKQLEAAAKANSNIYSSILSGKKTSSLNTTKKVHDEGTRDARSRTREILNKLTRTSSPTKAFVGQIDSTALVADLDSSSDGVLGTLERSLRKIHADLDYMSCGGA